MYYQFSNNSMKKNETLKLLALIAMFIDHLGYVFFPEHLYLRYIGRISLPIYAFYVANGIRYTSDINKYMIRLWVFALISQIPYLLLFDIMQLNILFTFLYAVFTITVINKKEFYWIPLLIFLIIILPFEGGLFAVSLVFLFYAYYPKHKFLTFVSYTMTVILEFYLFASYKYFGVLGVLFIYGQNYLPPIKLNRYVFYWFYPVHLSILLFFKFFV